MSSASLTTYLNWRKEPPLFRQFPPLLLGFPGERGHLRTANHPPILLFWGQGISGGGPWDKPSVYFQEPDHHNSVPCVFKIFIRS